MENNLGSLWLNAIQPTLKAILTEARRRRQLREGQESILSNYEIYKSTLPLSKRQVSLSPREIFELPLIQNFIQTPNFEYSSNAWNAIQDQVWNSLNHYIYSFETASYKHIYEANQVILARCSKTAPFPISIQRTSTCLIEPPSITSNFEAPLDINIQDQMEKELNKYCNRLTCSSCKATTTFQNFIQCSPCYCRKDTRLGYQLNRFFQSALSINPAKILAIKILFYWGGIIDKDDDYSTFDENNWEKEGKNLERWTCGDCCDVGKNIMRNGTTSGGKFVSGSNKKREGNVAVGFDKMVSTFHLILSWIILTDMNQ